MAAAVESEGSTTGHFFWRIQKFLGHFVLRAPFDDFSVSLIHLCTHINLNRTCVKLSIEY